MIACELYSAELSHIKLGKGFFEGWPNPPSEVVHRSILAQSYKSLVAIDQERNEIIGFVTAISDGVLSAYIPLLEVLPAYRGRGIGKQLVARMLNTLDHLYMIDVCCDNTVVPFYEKFGMTHVEGMVLRNYHNQSGKGSLDAGEEDLWK